MFVRAVDDKPSDTLVVVPGEGSWTGSSTLPHLHQSRCTHAVCTTQLQIGLIPPGSNTRCVQSGIDRIPLGAGPPNPFRRSSTPSP